jgi:peptidoglycan hydrolase-like protein with peptidoglycan-binding domain
MAGEPTIRFGSKGPFVADAQLKLLAKGFDPGPVDGDFGPRTRQAVVAFQAANGLLADGVVGNETWAALDDEAPVPPGVRGGGGGGGAAAPRQKVVFVGDPVFDGTTLTYTAQNVSGTPIAEESMVDVADVAFAGSTESSRVEFGTPPGGPIQPGETYAMDLSLEQFAAGSVVVIRIELDSRNVPDGPEVEVMVTVGVPGVVVLARGQQPQPRPGQGGGQGGGAGTRVVIDGDPVVSAGVVLWQGRNVGATTIGALSVVDLLVVNRELGGDEAENVRNQDVTVPLEPVEPGGTYVASADLSDLEPGDYTGVVQVDARGPNAGGPGTAGVFRFSVGGGPGGGGGGAGRPSVAIASGPTVGDGAVFYEAANVGDGVLPAFGHIDQIQVFDAATSDEVTTAGRGAPPHDVGSGGGYTSSIFLRDLPPGTYTVVLTVDAGGVTGAGDSAATTFTVPGDEPDSDETDNFALGVGGEFDDVFDEVFEDL